MTPFSSLSLLDTDMVSEVMKNKNIIVGKNARAYLRQFGQFAFSAITRYEVIRGLKRKSATLQMLQFQDFLRHSHVFAINDEVLDCAADLWVTASHGGHSCNDADLIIAATALEHGRVLVTGNADHFSWIPELTVENWRGP